MPDASITVITPTTGNDSLRTLIRSIEAQVPAMPVMHLLLWDDVRYEGAGTPDSYNAAHRHSIVLPSGTGRNGQAPGSQLRAIGLMAARTPWVTFADDDVWWESGHLRALQESAASSHWCTTLRII